MLGSRGIRDGSRIAVVRLAPGAPTGGFSMLWTIFVILLVLWLLGMVSSYTLSGYIHILLVVAVVVLLINLISGRRAL
jgi:hypothetical protein